MYVLAILFISTEWSQVTPSLYLKTNNTSQRKKKQNTCINLDHFANWKIKPSSTVFLLDALQNRNVSLTEARSGIKKLVST